MNEVSLPELPPLPTPIGEQRLVMTGGNVGISTFTRWGPGGVDGPPVAGTTLFTADQLRDYARAAVLAERERSARVCEKLRDEHCAGTQMVGKVEVACYPDDPSCELVAAWNEAAAAIRSHALSRADAPEDDHSPSGSRGGESIGSRITMVMANRR